MSENLCSQLKRYLSKEILSILQDAGTQASELGQKLFLVGGVVRDLFLGRPNFDLDVVVEGDAIELAQKLAHPRQVKAIVHHRFGTAKLYFADFSLDIATARRETYSCPGALPDVQLGSITDDLFRRDFSINAMALCLAPEQFGELIDLYRGEADIKDRVIRILHPNSFIDDATRVFRAIRYEQRLNFALETHTAELLQKALSLIETVSRDRIRHELMLMVMEEYPERALKRAGELGVLRELHPSLRGDGWIGERFKQARQLDKPGSLAVLYLCLLVYHFTLGENEQVMVRFNFPKKLAEATQQTLQIKAKLEHLAKPELKPSIIYWLLHGFVPQAIYANMLASEADIVRQRLHWYLAKLRYVKPLLTGDDLKKLGVPSGPSFGDVLHNLHEARLNGDVRTRQDEEKLVRRWLNNL